MPPDAVADRAFVHARVLAAPREHVWRAICEPALLARWWGPAGFSSTFEHFDFRPGGSWRFTMHGPDGKDYLNENVFAEIAAPSRVAIEHVRGHRFVLTITLDTPDAGTTRVGWQQVFDSAEERARIAAFVGPANEQNLDRLAALVAELAAPAG
jgi:uncharacterized protein YndB with AHSA1/START domain